MALIPRFASPKALLPGADGIDPGSATPQQQENRWSALPHAVIDLTRFPTLTLMEVARSYPSCPSAQTFPLVKTQPPSVAIRTGRDRRLRGSIARRYVALAGRTGRGGPACAGLAKESRCSVRNREGRKRDMHPRIASVGPRPRTSCRPMRFGGVLRDVEACSVMGALWRRLSTPDAFSQ